MTIQEITRLLDAGFNKDEILALVQDPAASTEQNQEQGQEQEKEQGQEQEKEQGQEQGQEQNQEQEKEQKQDQNQETEKRLSSIEASINSLVKAIQKQNLLNDHTNSNDETLEQQTDEIMKSIIRPEQKRKDDK